MSQYNDKMPANQQITMEECIASKICFYTDAREDQAADLGREILLLVLAEFRPDLIAKACPECKSDEITDYGERMHPRYLCRDCRNMFNLDELIDADEATD